MLCPGDSDINLFCYGQSVVQLDIEISDGTFDLRVAKQKLNCPEIISALVDQCCFCPPQGVRLKQPWVQPDAPDPVGNEARILPCGNAL